MRCGELFDDRYQLVRVLGSGGVGTVFEAHDRVFDRRVALKVLQFEAPEGLEAFRREFLLLSGTAHPHLVRCLDFGSGVHAGNRTHYFTSELVSGVHLLALDDDTFRRQALAALLDAVEALAWLHQSRLLHGDFKPENILLAERGGVLIDLSCARRIPAHQSTVSGTPGFIAPEVLRGGAVDARADVYAVGRTLEVLGRRFGGAFPAPLAGLAERALKEDPTQRPLDAAELLDVLHRTLAGRERGVRVPPIGAPRELLGRDAERLRATQALEDFVALKPGPRVIVISGPPGIGKTRLFRELKWWAQQRFTVFEGVTRGPEPLCKLLSRALPTLAQESGVDATLRARAELAQADRRVVLALDDAHDLPGSDALLLEALLRASKPNDACCWLVSSASAPSFSDPNILALPLRPLNEAAIAAWTGPYLSAVPAKQVAAWTGGIPRTLYEVCSELARGETREAELFADGAPRTADLWWQARVSALHEDCARALCLMSVLETPQPRARLARLGVSPSVLDELEGWRFLRLDGDTALLSRTRDARALRAHFGEARVRELAALAATELRGELSEALPRSERELRVARAAHLDVLAGRLDSAEAALAEAARASCAWAPDAWLACATELCAVHPTPENWERLAVVKDARGDLDGAIAAIVSGLRQRPAAPLTAALLCQAAFCHEKLGHVSRAVRLLRRAERVCRDHLASARPALVEARCCLREGRYREATTIAMRALGSASGSHVAAQLHEVAALAFGYLGTPKEAERHLEQALALHGPDLPPRARVRLVSYCALQAYRSGQAQLATSFFTEALELAEQSGLGDLLATAALNAGTAAHQAGDWGAALSAYERGLRAATAYGKDRTRATLRFNLAKLFADIGALERAQQHLASVEADLRHGGLRELEGAILGLRAEIACARGEFDGALELLNEASALHAASGRARELVEADLQRVDVLLKLGQLADATRVLEENAPRLGPLAAPDLELRQALASASVALRTERYEAALAHVEHALRCDDAVGQVALRAQLQALMSELYSRTGASHLADQARRSSRAAWERVSLKLPKELRDVFYRHPERRRSPEPAQEQPAHDNSLLRVLAINRRLSSTLDVPAILELAMDSAIELTGAERGFLLLSPGARARPGLQVAVARNLDRERLGKSHFKFSQDIAQRVLASGEPVLSIDASSDPRFESSVSIHAMRLRSVVCVPIRAHERVLGALYLDNRFQQGRFREADIVVLAAFADQVAIALHNGRLWAELQQRTEQLEREQGRVRELVAAQARQIDELTDELERERQHIGSLHELGGIVGASPAMTRIRGMIRRVAQSALPVLIQGESGTGKELVAKAIAGQGASGAKPFLAINCAALPHALLESELFGHRKGAFTDAVREHPGVFVAAKGGTLFLDEIGEIPLPLQAKLLRVIQEREVQPVGSEKCVRIDDVRLIFATNRKLSDEVARGLFREDLFYRVSVVEIVVPPLRERLEDVPSLCAALLERIAQRQGEAPRRLSRAALARLLRYAWPGNVRQLENVLARAVVLSENAEIAAHDIDLPSAAAPALSARSRSELRRAEAEAIREALVRSNYNVCEVSRTLGIPRTSLYRKLRRYELLKSPA